MNRWLAAFAALFLLSACGIAPVREALPPAQQAAAEARQEEREAVLAGVDAWSLGGRVGCQFETAIDLASYYELIAIMVKAG